MDVDDSVLKSPEERRCENPHETGQHDQIDFGFFQNAYQFVVKVFPAGIILMFDNRTGNMMISCPGQSVCLRIIAHNDLNPCTEVFLFNMIDDGLKI